MEVAVPLVSRAGVFQEASESRRDLLGLPDEPHLGSMAACTDPKPRHLHEVIFEPRNTTEFPQTSSRQV
eukprot:2589023-Amphidinium_carterae.1